MLMTGRQSCTSRATDSRAREDLACAAHLPHVPVEICERAGVSPLLTSGCEDDAGAGILRAAHQLVHLGASGNSDEDLALVGRARRSLATADHPAEADRWDQHHTQ